MCTKCRSRKWFRQFKELFSFCITAQMETCIYSWLTKPANATAQPRALIFTCCSVTSRNLASMRTCKFPSAWWKNAFVEKDDIFHVKLVTSSLRIVTVMISEKRHRLHLRQFCTAYRIKMHQCRKSGLIMTFEIIIWLIMNTDIDALNKQTTTNNICMKNNWTSAMFGPTPATHQDWFLRFSNPTSTVRM